MYLSITHIAGEFGLAYIYNSVVRCNDKQHTMKRGSLAGGIWQRKQPNGDQLNLCTCPRTEEITDNSQCYCTYNRNYQNCYTPLRTDGLTCSIYRGVSVVLGRERPNQYVISEDKEASAINNLS